jgi:hypothetical protein
VKGAAASATSRANFLREVPVDGKKKKQEGGTGQKSMAQWGHSLNLGRLKELTPSDRTVKDARFSRGDFFIPSRIVTGLGPSA